MRQLLLLPVLLLAVLFATAQKEMNPKLGPLINKTPQGEIAWRKQQQGCEAFFKKTADRGGYERLTAAEQKRYDQCSDDEMKGYWDAVGDGCSWYCGGGPDSIWASSSLKTQAGISYKADNAHDLSYKNAWVEGAPGNGVGQYLVYRFQAAAPRITDIIVVNGYVKSERSWRDNARVKKLKMYIDNKPFAILNLQDNRNEQIFHFEPIGTADRDNYEALNNRPPWTMKFEILEVYKGDRFEDCAITEIYFDGIDVHCLGAGTQVTMADGSLKSIETIKKGEQVMSYDPGLQRMVQVTVTGLIQKQHNSLLKLVFEDRGIITTADHPFYTETNKWASVNPERSNMNYLQGTKVNQLSAGQRVFLPSENKYITLLRIEKLNGPQQTYTLELKGADSFVANGMLVKTEEIR